MAYPDERVAGRRPRATLLIGPPASGKGTLGKILGQVPGFSFVSMGQVLREVAPGNERYPQIQACLQQGELVPAEVALSIWKDYLDRHCGEEWEAGTGMLLLDGLPRNVQQAQLLRPQVSVERVLRLACEDEAVLVARIRQRSAQRARSDDADPEVIRRRFAIYHQQTEPLFTFYPQRMIATVAAERTPLEVLAQSVEVLVADQRAASRRRPSRLSDAPTQGDQKHD